MDKRRILVVVDMQNDFTSGVLGNPECEANVAKVVETIKSGKFDDIIMTRDTHTDNYLETLEGKNLPVKHCIIPTNGWQIRPEIIKVAQENGNITYIDKVTFGSIGLGNALARLSDDNTEIYFCGVCTGICVINNVAIAKAFLPENEVYVIEDACACVTPESHKTAINAMKTFQTKIITTKDLNL